VNGKILAIFAALMVVAMLATPVVALGPQNAVKNPNISMPVSGWAQLFLPSGLFTEWLTQYDPPFFFQHKDAAKFQIGNAIEITVDDPTDLDLFFGNENKWMYLTHDSYATFLVFVGVDPSFADLYPEGLYIRMVVVGK